jgi:hypothetical protein
MWLSGRVLRKRQGREAQHLWVWVAPKWTDVLAAVHALTLPTNAMHLGDSTGRGGHGLPGGREFSASTPAPGTAMATTTATVNYGAKWRNNAMLTLPI